MEELDSSYWRKHTRRLLVAGLCGFAYVVFAMRMPVHNRGFILGMFLTFALLCSPFTLKTAAGRLWWAAYLIMLGSGVTAVLLGVHNPLSWICAVIAGCAYAVGVCLRWKPPVASVIRRRLG